MLMKVENRERLYDDVFSRWSESTIEQSVMNFSCKR